MTDEERTLLTATELLAMARNTGDGGMALAGRDVRTVIIYGDRVEIETGNGWLVTGTAAPAPADRPRRDRRRNRAEEVEPAAEGLGYAATT
jgi:hypothetical protein